MKIIFAASADISVLTINALAESSRFELVALLTNPDSAKGRKKELSPTDAAVAVEEISKKFNKHIKIFKPAVFDKNFYNEILSMNADLLVSFAYGKFFSDDFLSLFPKGGINIHPSLLPKYRGATPIAHAILNGDSETGISIQSLSSKLDCGDILIQEKFSLDGTETTSSLTKIVGKKSPALLLKVLENIADEKGSAIAQNDNEASFCSKFIKGDGVIDWRQSAKRIDSQIRAFTPWPLSGTVHNGLPLYILAGKAFCDIMVNDVPGRVLAQGIEAEILLQSKRLERIARPAQAGCAQGILVQTGCGVYCVQSLQYKTKKALGWKDFLNGAHDFIGSVLG